MAKMSQKELLEEGFSDKIRGIAKAAGAGIKQAAAQGTRLDTGQLAKGMHGAYKGEQPIAVLKKALAKSKDIEIVKINKSGIKKQQASAKKGYIGRIVGPKSITLIPFEGVLLGKSKKPDARQYEGPSAGAIKEGFAPEDAEATGQDRDETGAIKAVHKGGRVGTQIKDLLVKHGIGEGEAARLSQYDEKGKGVRTAAIFKETHPNIKFTYNPNPEMSTVDVEKTKHAEIAPGDVRESISLKDIIQLSREVLIIERELSQTPQNIRRRERAAAARRKKKEVANKADEAEKRFKERNPEVTEPEPEPVAEPEVKEVDPKNLPYLATGDHRKFIATLDDKVVLDLLKLKQKIQPGLQIEFEGEKKRGAPAGVASDFQGEEGMFVAEIFRTKEGLQVGDIYRQEDPTTVVWSGAAGGGVGKGKEEKVSPFDEVVAKLTAENQLNVQMLVPRLQQHRLLKSNKKILSLTADIIKKYTGRSDDKLQEVDIKKIKAGLIKDRIIAEGTSQKNLLRQLTLLSR